MVQTIDISNYMDYHDFAIARIINKYPDATITIITDDFGKFSVSQPDDTPKRCHYQPGGFYKGADFIRKEFGSVQKWRHFVCDYTLGTQSNPNQWFFSEIDERGEL